MSGGKCPGGSCPGGFCPVTILVMLCALHISTTYSTEWVGFFLLFFKFNFFYSEPHSNIVRSSSGCLSYKHILHNSTYIWIKNYNNF